jgi:cation transport ATPase
MRDKNTYRYRNDPVKKKNDIQRDRERETDRKERQKRETEKRDREERQKGETEKREKRDRQKRETDRKELSACIFRVFIGSLAGFFEVLSMKIFLMFIRVSDTDVAVAVIHIFPLCIFFGVNFFLRVKLEETIYD